MLNELGPIHGAHHQAARYMYISPFTAHSALPPMPTDQTNDTIGRFVAIITTPLRTTGTVFILPVSGAPLMMTTPSMCSIVLHIYYYFASSTPQRSWPCSIQNIGLIKSSVYSHTGQTMPRGTRNKTHVSNELLPMSILLSLCNPRKFKPNSAIHSTRIFESGSIIRSTLKN